MQALYKGYGYFGLVSSVCIPSEREKVLLARLFFFFFEKEKKDTKNGKLKFKKEKVFGSQVSLVFDSSGNLTVLGFYCCE